MAPARIVSKPASFLVRLVCLLVTRKEIEYSVGRKLDVIEFNAHAPDAIWWRGDQISYFDI